MKTTFKELLLCNKYHKPAPLNIKNNEKCGNIFCFSNRAVWQYSFNMELSDQKKKNLKNPTSSPHSKTELTDTENRLVVAGVRGQEKEKLAKGVKMYKFPVFEKEVMEIQW